MVAGHDEYWTKRMRDAFDAPATWAPTSRSSGANIDYWQIRYENGRRTVVEYRKASRDPETDPALETVMSRNLVPPRPECQLLGVQGIVEPGNQSIGIKDLTVNPAALSDPWFARTGFAPTTVLPGLVGYEWDLISPGCATPPLTVLFHTPGTPSFDAVRYTAASGARVFSAGTLRFSWGLDPASAQSNAGLQQFMRNALDDLTRPAPPASLRAVRTRAGVRIAVGWPTDPRPRELLVYARTGSQPFLPATRGARLVCRTRGATCMDSLAARSRPVRYVAILRDRWRPSAPLLSRTVR